MATRASGMKKNVYGNIEDLVLGMKVHAYAMVMMKVHADAMVMMKVHADAMVMTPTEEISGIS